MIYIYTITDEAGAIHYVGKTSDMRTRFVAHQSAAKNPKTDFHRWMRDYKGAIVMEPIEAVEKHHLSRNRMPIIREAYWIERFRDEGHPIKNVLPRRKSNFVLVETKGGKLIADTLRIIRETV